MQGAPIVQDQCHPIPACERVANGGPHLAIQARPPARIHFARRCAAASPSTTRAIRPSAAQCAPIWWRAAAQANGRESASRLHREQRSAAVLRRPSAIDCARARRRTCDAHARDMPPRPTAAAIQSGKASIAVGLQDTAEFAQVVARMLAFAVGRIAVEHRWRRRSGEWPIITQAHNRPVRVLPKPGSSTGTVVSSACTRSPVITCHANASINGVDAYVDTRALRRVVGVLDERGSRRRPECECKLILRAPQIRDGAVSLLEKPRQPAEMRDT
jgi:hypothetical protein